MAMFTLPNNPGKVQLGLKAGAEPQQLLDRLKYRPTVFEFFTAVTDFEPTAFQTLKQSVRFVRDTVTPKIVIHHPMAYGDWHLDQLLDPHREAAAYHFLQRSTAQLLDLANDLNVRVLIHGGYGGAESRTLIAEYPSLAVARHTVATRLDHLVAQANGHVIIENGITPSFMYGDPELDRTILQHGWPLVCDLSHVFIGLNGDMDRTMAALTRLKPLIQHYHLVDSLGRRHDSLPLGRGLIDWRRVLPALNPAATMIYEVPDETDATCANMLQSYHYLRRLEVQQLENQVDAGDA
ncbi:TIM barrel protein [Levilactobacillus suantsaii]|uniref:Sugar phosphate isomerase/epimerase n=1 Tax=Levilactobacillus suantsaii TaxID=2292255 RepID=A0A4Q0VJP0_9LACO|nr:TIM barrel protein [Levilactobacillus suantsaii]RXI78274.1 sugar phosphate isomerase/epimerase [Levilactobacillus suantsaii]